MFRVEDLENLIDECNMVLDEEKERIFYQTQTFENGKPKNYVAFLSDTRNVRHIRAMAYALRKSISFAEEQER